MDIANKMTFGLMGKGGADESKMETAAQKKMNLLKGYQAIWIKSRREDGWYAFNKICSIAIGVAFACITLSFKKTTQIFMLQELTENADKTDPKDKSYAAYHILTIYWFLFIYFSLAAMDEMIELFSVLNQMEKGALGLFFELNYLIGMFLTGYIGWFIWSNTRTSIEYNGTLTGDKLTAIKADFANMYNWLYFHFIYIFVSLVLCVVVHVIFRKMNTRAKALKDTNKKQREETSSKVNSSI